MSKPKQKILGAGLLTIVITVGAFVVMFSWQRSHAASTKKGVVADAVQAQASAFRSSIRVFIHKDDIRPRVIHVQPGKTLLTTENLTLDDVAIVVERVMPNQNTAVGRGVVSSRRKRAMQELTLPVGEYVFYEASRPSISGRIIVEPRGQN